MQTYRRFVSYVYQYENGKKAGNRGFIKVEARGNTCSVQISLKGICKDGNGSCGIYGFKREDGLLKGSLLAQCPVKSGVVQEQLAFPRNRMGKAQYGLQELSGIIFQGDDQTMYGTQWDDEAMKMENFQPDERNDASQDNREAAEERQRQEREQRWAGPQAGEWTADAGYSGWNREEAEGRQDGSSMPTEMLQGAESVTEEMQEEHRPEDMVSGGFQEGGTPGNLPEEGTLAGSMAADESAGDSWGDGMQMDERTEYPLEDGVSGDEYSEGNMPKDMYQRDYPEGNMPEAMGQGDYSEGAMPEDMYQRDYPERSMPEAMHPEGSQEGNVPENMPGNIDSEGYQGNTASGDMHPENCQESFPADGMAAEGMSEETQREPEMGLEAAEIGNPIDGAGNRVEAENIVGAELGEELTEILDTTVPIPSFMLERNAEGETARENVPSERMSSGMDDGHMPSEGNPDGDGRDILREGMPERMEREAPGGRRMEIPRGGIPAKRGMNIPEARIPVRNAPDMPGIKPSAKNERGIQEWEIPTKGRRRTAEPDASPRKSMDMQPDSAPSQKSEGSPKKGERDNYIKPGQKTGSASKEKNFCPFSDGILEDCRKIKTSDLRFLDSRDQNLRNNRFVQHGYQMFGHLLLAKIARNGQYILGVPGMYQQQEKFMADMFGFHNFKYANNNGPQPSSFGYWYRLVYPPKTGRGNGRTK